MPSADEKTHSVEKAFSTRNVLYLYERKYYCDYIRIYILRKRKVKIARHLTFWGIYCCINFFVELDPTSINSFFGFALYRDALLNLGFFLPVTILYVYAFIYLLIPIFIKPKKYLAFVTSAFLVLGISFIIDYFISRLILRLTYPGMGYSDLFRSSIQTAYAEAVHYGLAVCACAMGIKLARNGYLQQIENTKLIKRGTDNKIKLLKSHIQPEFLFHSLNNLYKKIKEYPDEAPEIVLHLSEIFSYILYDTAEEKTALAKELSAVEHLITVEKMQGNSLEVSADITGNSSDKYITPLLLFSILQHVFVERENTEYHNIESIHTVMNVKDEALHLSVQFKNPADGNRIKPVIQTLVTDLQKTLPSGYLEYGKERKDEMSITIGLL